MGKHSLFSGPVDESGILNGEQYLIDLPQDSLQFIRSGPTSGEYLPLYIILYDMINYTLVNIF